MSGETFVTLGTKLVLGMAEITCWIALKGSTKIEGRSIISEFFPSSNLVSRVAKDAPDTVLV